MTHIAFDALLKALDLNSNREGDTLNTQLAHELDRGNVWFGFQMLRGSSENPLAVLQALVIDHVRGGSLDSKEFEAITGLPAHYACAETLDGLSEQAAFEAAGRLVVAFLAAGRNQAREVIREHLPYACDPDEDAARAVEAWRARRAARMASASPAVRALPARAA